MSADDDVRLAADLRLDRAGDEGAADAELHADPLDREEVLLRERLGRGHQRALAAGLDRAQQRVQRHDGLARADVPLEQALHRRRPREVGVDLRDRLLLVLGQLERQRVPVAADQLARLGERSGDLLLALGRAPGERQLQHEQLVEGEPLPPLLGLFERARLVDRRQGVAAERQPALRLQPRRERVGAVGHERQRRLDQLAQLRGRDLLARRVDGCEVGRRGAAVEVERADREAEPVRRPAQADVRSRLQLLLQPRLVEPGRADLAGAVRDLRGQDLEPAAPAAQRRPEHLALDQHLLVPEEVGDPLLRRRPLVAARPVVEQVAGALEPQLREPLLQRRPDAGQRVQRRLQPLRAEAAARRRPALRRVHGGETGLGPAHRPSIAPGPASLLTLLARRSRCVGREGSRPVRQGWNQKKPTVPGLRACRRPHRGS